MTRQLNRIGCWTCSVLIGVGLGRGTLAADTPVETPVETPQFDAQAYLSLVKPVLEQRCYACHGALKQEGGLRLDTAELAVLGGDSGSAVIPGDVEASLLLERIASDDEHERMPPEGEPLHSDQIAALAAWIRGGASAPADEVPERDPADHWAFRPPQRPSLPNVVDRDWGENPIDRFLAAAHHQHELVPQPLADRWLWLRRVTLDLSGLPPTPREQAEFLADTSGQARQRVVDRLLASPRYGERWGRHWMDIWRYSDWWGLGDEVRSSQPHIWHWRDWIVESLNADVGYDQMLREMLAADELYPNDLQRLRGTGFLARQYFKFNRTTWLDGLIEHTAKAMLGLTVNCAKCHDHKYDPISQHDYYAMRAIFEPYQLRTEAVAGVLDHRQGGIPRAFDCNLDAPTFLHFRGDDRQPDESGAIPPGLPELLTAQLPLVIEPVALPLEAYRPGLRPVVREELLRQAQRQLDEAEQLRQRTSLALAELPQTPAGGPVAETAEGERRRLEIELGVAEAACRLAAAKRQAVEARYQAEWAEHGDPSVDQDDATRLAKAAVVAERRVAAETAEHQAWQAELALLGVGDQERAAAEEKLTAARQAAQQAWEAIEQDGGTYTPLPGAYKTLESNVETEASRSRPFPSHSSGRRSGLAAWLTDRRNPLVARVAVNHLWTRHMGSPLVTSVFDFGRQGAPPSHPELLDWLAVELIESGWSLKHIQRLLVTSRAYQLSSTQMDADPGSLQRDPDNRYYWRRPTLRMEAQVVRDSLLALAGELDLTMAGPSIPAADQTTRRRSLYFFHSHNEHQPFLAMFDDANVLDCYRRSESIVPQQALALENSELAMAMAERIADRVAAELTVDDDRAFVAAIFQRVLGAPATDPELELSLRGLAELQHLAESQQRPQPQQFARRVLVQALINHNDFVTIR